MEDPDLLELGSIDFYDLAGLVDPLFPFECPVLCMSFVIKDGNERAGNA